LGSGLSPADPIALAALIVRILDELRIPYVIGGSVAASIYGEPRTTLDVDIMIDAEEKQVAALIDRLENDFHVDRDDAVEAARQRSSFSAVHIDTTMKVDFFMTERGSFASQQIARGRKIRIAGNELRFYSPEDILIRKLMCYRSGGEQSDRQWRDVVGVMRTSKVDMMYLRSAAGQVGVTDLLERVEKETQE